MAKAKVQEKVAEVVEAVEEEHSPLYELSRKVLLAAIGVVALAQDEVEAFVNKLLERGEIAEKDARKLIDEVVSRRKEDAKKAGSEVDKQVEELLGRMSVPSKNDIEALSAKITALTEKVEALKKNGS
jgi:poly(hydroxyalkanoate) granule-associated protein